MRFKLLLSRSVGMIGGHRVVAGAFPVPSLVLGEWVIVGETDWGANCGCDEFIRLRRIKP
jgi:hypothetical protein